MSKSKEFASVKRFGARYGATIKARVGKIEYLKNNSTKCPFCLKDAVKRKSVGIWTCSKCNTTFAGKAYTFSKRKTAKQLREEFSLQAVEKQETEQVGEA